MDDTARICDADSGKEIALLISHTGRVLSTRFNPDGVRVVTTSNDHTARIWWGTGR